MGDSYYTLQKTFDLLGEQQQLEIQPTVDTLRKERTYGCFQK